MRTILMILMLIVVAYSANNRVQETLETSKAHKMSMENTLLANM